MLVTVAACLSPATIVGQELTDKTNTSATQPITSDGDLAKYDQLINQISTSVEDAQEASMQFYVNGLEDSYHWRDEWRAGKEKTSLLLADFRATACRIYGSESPQPESLEPMIRSIVEDMYRASQFQDLDIALEKMLAGSPDDSELKKKLGLVYLKTNRFKQAYHLLVKIDPAEIGTFDVQEQGLLRLLPNLIGAYEHELKMREKEEQANDLPRVELVTPSGKIVVELFENEAPETVANFISLVESGHYDNLLFHRVIQDFMAQCGGFSENNSPVSIGYTINDEFKNENFRRHFSGSISMANTGKPKSGSAQFFINFIATPFLDGKHTVFGTVIEGAATCQRIALTHSLDENGKEKPIDSAVPDKILSAKVLRKRDHPYRPTKAQEQALKMQKPPR